MLVICLYVSILTLRARCATFDLPALEGKYVIKPVLAVVIAKDLRLRKIVFDNGDSA